MYSQRCVTTTSVQCHQIFLIWQRNCHSLPHSIATVLLYPQPTRWIWLPLIEWLWSIFTFYHDWHFAAFDLVFTCPSADGCKTCLHLGEHELFSFEHCCVDIWITVFIFFWHELRSELAGSYGSSVCDSFKDCRIGFHTGGNILFWEDKTQQYIIVSDLWP